MCDASCTHTHTFVELSRIHSACIHVHICNACCTCIFVGVFSLEFFHLQLFLCTPCQFFPFHLRIIRLALELSIRCPLLVQVRHVRKNRCYMQRTTQMCTATLKQYQSKRHNRTYQTASHTCCCCCVPVGLPCTCPCPHISVFSLLILCHIKLTCNYGRHSLSQHSSCL